MKKTLTMGAAVVLVALGFVVQANANESNGNNNCGKAVTTDNCLTPGSQPWPLPQVVNPPLVDITLGDHRYDRRRHFNDPFDRGFFGDDGYGYDESYLQRRHRPSFYLEYQTRPNYPVYQSANRCERIASSLRNSGFRKIRAISCNGRTYAYTAYRDGEKLQLAVNSRNGRITRIRPIYY